MKRITLLALVPLAVVAVTAACSPIRTYCEAAAECDDLEARLLDPVGESNDSVNVCVADQEGAVRVLRANEEEGCQEQADALLAYYACVADAYVQDPGDACDGFIFSSDRNPCFSELDDVLDAAGDNGDDCRADEE
jgi:hypothetical protein